jgi:hypothetical protein
MDCRGPAAISAVSVKSGFRGARLALQPRPGSNSLSSGPSVPSAGVTGAASKRGRGFSRQPCSPPTVTAALGGWGGPGLGRISETHTGRSVLGPVHISAGRKWICPVATFDASPQKTNSQEEAGGQQRPAGSRATGTTDTSPPTQDLLAPRPPALWLAKEDGSHLLGRAGQQEWEPKTPGAPSQVSTARWARSPRPHPQEPWAPVLTTTAPGPRGHNCSLAGASV